MKTPNFLEIQNLHSAELFKDFTLTSKEIEDLLQASTLDVMKKPNVFFVERKMRLPMFAADFYHYIYKFHTVPSQDQFIEYYKESNKAYLDKVITNDDFVSGLYGRLCRTYPSLVRDIHFLRKLEELGGFDEVDYNLEVDLFGKADILIQQNGVWFGIKLRVKTRNSDSFAAIKNGGTRGTIGMDYISIEIPMDLDKAFSLTTQKDSVKLYHNEAVADVRNTIRNHKGE